MSDISIPGVSDTYGSNQMIDDLLEVERTRLTTLETRLEDFESSQDTWQNLKTQVTSLRDAAKGLYGFENPFSERVVESSDESVLTATASRDAFTGTREVTVLETAGRDRFTSTNLDEDYEVAAGTYAFSVGEEEISFRYRGGSLNHFAETLTEKGGDSVRASVIRNTTTTKIIVIESLKEGQENALLFGEDAIPFALDTEILEEGVHAEISVNPSEIDIQAWRSSPTPEAYSIEDGRITLQPGVSLTLSIQPTVILSDMPVLEYTTSWTDLPTYSEVEQTPPSGPSLPPMPSVTFGGVSLQSENPVVSLPDWEPPEIPDPVVDNQIISVSGDGRTLALAEESPGGGTVQVNLKGRLQTVYSLHLENNNTERAVSIEGIRFFDPAVSGEYRPVHAIERAGDARIEMDGIEIERTENSIDDIIPGVTLNLRKASTEPISIEITPDKESIKEKIINFIGFYNQLVTSINIVTQNDEDIINEIDYFSDDDREDAMNRLGSMRGDLTLMQMKSRLQAITMNPYDSGSPDLTLLAQMGISSNAAGGSTGGYDASRLRGYLEIDEAVLDQFFENDIDTIKNFFGRDSDGDLIIDSGIAVSMENYLKPYNQVGGFLPSKISNLDNYISSAQDDIDDFNTYLEDYEADLREKYGNMEGMLQTLQSQTTAIDNLNNSLGGN